MNGRPRDAISTDLGAERPTLSPAADALARRVVALMSNAESRALFERLEAEARRSPSHVDWLRSPTRYLAEFDATTVAEIERNLTELHEELTRRAKARGWEARD